MPEVSPKNLTSPKALTRRKNQTATINRRPILGIWRLGRAIHQSDFSELTLAQPADALGSPRWDYVLRRGEGGNEMESLRQIRQFTTCATQVFHPNLVAVLDASDSGSSPFLVMPRLEGTTMQHHLDHQPPKALPVGLWLVRQVSQALEAMHVAGWVHGDVKPENVMVGSTGHVTLIDLGFAERIHSAPNRLFRGTPEYAAPESVSGQSVTLPASDIFSLGRMLWRWMTKVNVPNELQLSPVAELVEKMIAESPNDRPTAAHISRELLRLEIESLGCHIEPDRRSRRAA
ncbi:protein kinase domain-containing protein [Novipirellula artificiosorum]|uniref:Serine/threonine-protein kinase PrkC n=1 Tax=Novipirellula artificiosorum TaxID=2528016 RepID=A0A5C6DZM1_9BACT|nr:protein kinase [Novipirellula artificiosorum]TWU41895.1 Serine/threonine-protein kinase PrkC [Novipirellula artificiosorum]